MRCGADDEEDEEDGGYGVVEAGGWRASQACRRGGVGSMLLLREGISQMSVAGKGVSLLERMPS